MAIEILDFLAEQDLFPKFYMRCKTSQIEKAAFGSLKTYDYLPSPLDSSQTFYGAIPFSQTNKPFFFLPQQEISQTGNFSNKKNPFIPNLTFKETSPSKEVWDQSIDFILQKQKERSLEKLVLARKTTFTFDAHTNPYLFVKKLADENPYSTVFFLQKDPSSLFLGATPEKLYTRKGNRLQTEAVAGTRKRGKTAQEDDLLAMQLLQGIKEDKEFSLVCDFLIQALTPLCESLDATSKKTLIKTHTVQHLYRSFSATLSPHVTDFSLTQALHPTPAVGGLPQDCALQWIKDLEPFDRSFYAGPIGWYNQDEASFHVAIRSGFLQDGHLHAFSGAGIVPGSCPHAEWEELNHKIAHWM